MDGPERGAPEASVLLAPVRRLARRRLAVRSGARILGVGCGPGEDTLTLADGVGAGGMVLAADLDPQALAMTGQRAAAAGLTRRVALLRADARALPLASQSVNAALAARLLVHLADPERAVREIVRVTAPGGRVVLWDADIESLCWDTPDAALQRRLSELRVAALPGGSVGRSLYRLAREAGLQRVRASVVSLVVTRWALLRAAAGLDLLEQQAVLAGVATSGEIAVAEDRMRESDRRGTFFGHGAIVVVAGERP